MSLRNTLKPLALLLGATFAIAPLASFADDLPVKIGFAAPLTGANAGYGKDLENGVRLAIEEANAQKIKIGDKVAQFELVSQDDQADPRIGVQAAQKLVDSGVVGGGGPLQLGHDDSRVADLRAGRHSGDRSGRHQSDHHRPRLCEHLHGDFHRRAERRQRRRRMRST